MFEYVFSHLAFLSLFVCTFAKKFEKVKLLMHKSYLNKNRYD